MIGHSLQGARADTFRGASGADPAQGCGNPAGNGAERVAPPARLGPTQPRNTPRHTIPGVTTRILDRVGIGIVPTGFEDQYAELEALVCSTCGGTGEQPGEPQPDRYGVFTACDSCEGTGVKDPH